MVTHIIDILTVSISMGEENIFVQFQMNTTIKHYLFDLQCSLHMARRTGRPGEAGFKIYMHLSQKVLWPWP